MLHFLYDVCLIVILVIIMLTQTDDTSINCRISSLTNCNIVVLIIIIIINMSLLYGRITVERLKCCDWSVHKLIEVNFSKLKVNNQMFRNDFECIRYHLCKIFAPYDFLEMNMSITTWYYLMNERKKKKKCLFK